MPVGFQSYNADGVLTCDLTDRLPKIVLSGSIVPPLQRPVTINVAGIVNDGTWYVTSTQETVVVINNGSFTLTRVDRRLPLPDPEPNEVYYSVIKQ